MLARGVRFRGTRLRTFGPLVVVRVRAPADEQHRAAQDELRVPHPAVRIRHDQPRAKAEHARQPRDRRARVAVEHRRGHGIAARRRAAFVVRRAHEQVGVRLELEERAARGQQLEHRVARRDVVGILGPRPLPGRPVGPLGIGDHRRARLRLPDLGVQARAEAPAGPVDLPGERGPGRGEGFLVPGARAQLVDGEEHGARFYAASRLVPLRRQDALRWVP